MSEIITLLKQVGIFMVCAQTVVHFKPQQKYDKYLKLLIGIMVMVQLISPVFAFLGKEDGLGAKASQPITWQNTSFDINQMLYTAEEIVDRYTENEVKSRLNNEDNTNVGEREIEGKSRENARKDSTENESAEEEGSMDTREEFSKETREEETELIKVEDIKIDEIRLNGSAEDDPERTVE